MRKAILQKGLVIGLIFLFIGLSIIPIVNSNQQINQTIKNINITSQYSNKNVNNVQLKEYLSYKSSDFKNVYVEIAFFGRYINIQIGLFGFYFYIRVIPFHHPGMDPVECRGNLKIYENGELILSENYIELEVKLIFFKGTITLFPLFDFNGGEIQGTTSDIIWSGVPI